MVMQVAMTEVSLTPYSQLLTTPVMREKDKVRLQGKGKRWGREKVPTAFTGKQKRQRGGLC